ncbi:hypothetical protein [Thermoplasma acidophilum]|uniref:Amino acid permease/ SLC12A domain-containing protein n=1 Tax=Thermoplasma acidophilum (strain ATCC 25905 / DSM 1728 / JCM 9062 / NBRC 15155 / AMRC-C165) TaxID=273075 RepID=Q9HKE0_THEAC|nr:amino acid permease [Thermoplasma acidophilum]CAC11799.1 hypothetical protein [Thermoplasma acidophilum]
MAYREDSEARKLGTWDLVFQGLGQITPITILSGLIVSIVGLSGINAPLAMLISFVAVVLAANTIYQFSGIISHAGGYYAYVEHGLGRHVGKFTGLQYLLYQASNLALEYLIVIWGFSKSLNYAFGTSLPVWSGMVWMGSMMALSYVLMRRGAKPSLRLALILGSIQIAFVAILSMIIIPSADDNTVQAFIPSSGSGWTGVFLGFIVGGYLAFAGYGSVVPMGEEARSPRKTIKKAIIAIVVMAGAIFVLGSYAMVVGFGLSNLGNFSSSIIPGLIVARRFTGLAGAVIFIVVSTFLSTYGTVIGMGTPMTRVMYALGRDRVLPGWLGRIDGRGVPARSIDMTYAISAVSAAMLGTYFYLADGFYAGLFYAWAIFGTIATLSTLLIHILTNTSLSVSSVKRRSGNFIFWIALPSLTTILMITAYYYSLIGMTMPYLIAPIVFAAWIVISALILMARKDEYASIDFSPSMEHMGAGTGDE